MPAQSKGRPQGSANKKPDYVTVAPSRCKKCGSTNRTPYTTRQEHEIAGLDAAGNEYTHIVWRRTSCANCGQFRIDRTTENRPPERPARRKK